MNTQDKSNLGGVNMDKNREWIFDICETLDTLEIMFLNETSEKDEKKQLEFSKYCEKIKYILQAYEISIDEANTVKCMAHIQELNKEVQNE